MPGCHYTMQRRPCNEVFSRRNLPPHFVIATSPPLRLTFGPTSSSQLMPPSPPCPPFSFHYSFLSSNPSLTRSPPQAPHTGWTPACPGCRSSVPRTATRVNCPLAGSGSTTLTTGPTTLTMSTEGPSTRTLFWLQRRPTSLSVSFYHHNLPLSQQVTLGISSRALCLTEFYLLMVLGVPSATSGAPKYLLHYLACRTACSF